MSEQMNHGATERNETEANELRENSSRREVREGLCSRPGVY